MARKKKSNPSSGSTSLALQVSTTSAHNASAPSKRRKKKSSRRQGRMGKAALRAQNPYLHSLLYPEDHTDAKIPDQGMSCTSVCPVTWDTSLTVDANGNAGAVISPTGYYQIATCGGTGNSISSWTGASYPNSTVTTALQGQFLKWRVVSGSMNIQFYGADLSDGGLLSTALVPTVSNLSTTNSVPNTSSGQPANWVSVFPSSYTLPLKNGSRRLYKPQDVYSYGMLDSNQWGSGGNLTTSGSAIVVVAGFPVWAVGVTGATAGSSVRIRIDLNIEFIPTSDFVNTIMTSPGVNDPIALARAENVVGNSLLASPAQGNIFDTALGAARDFASGALSSMGGAYGIGSALAGMAIASRGASSSRRLITY